MLSTKENLQKLPIEINIDLKERSYSILIGENIWSQASSFLSMTKASSAVIVTNTKVADLFLQEFKKNINKYYDSIHEIILPDGESYKNWETLNLIFDALLKNNCDRKTILYALGGGVIGDMTGFAAACYMRGVPFVQVPTTLLAQVDSSVGGKTAINHPLGKNMIGAFYQPQRVLCDLKTLKSLPPRELSAGLAEVIKYGPIADMSFLAWIETNINALRACDINIIAYAVQRSCEIKAAIVAQDERESGLRAILNFGHTFGHAIESGLGYGKWLHGEGVGCGMVMAAHLSHQLGLIDLAYVERLTRVIHHAGLPIIAPKLSDHDNAESYLKLMRVDKKADAGQCQFVVLDGAGKAIVRSAPDALVRKVIDLCSDPQTHKYSL